MIKTGLEEGPISLEKKLYMIGIVRDKIENSLLGRIEYKNEYERKLAREKKVNFLKL